MASTSDFRNGLCLEFNNDLVTIVEFLHVKPGKGAAFVRTKLKSLKTGRVVQHTFNAGVKVTVARIERRPYQYIYKDDTGFQFMNMESFEQIPIPEDLVGSAAPFLKEGQDVEIMFHADTETPLSVEMPAYVVVEVTYTEPGVRGDTATNTLKPAKIDSGGEVNVPLFINEGDKIKVDTRTGAYSERVKS